MNELMIKIYSGMILMKLKSRNWHQTQLH